MIKEKLNVVLSIMGITALIGLLLLLFSPSLGTAMAGLWLSNRGGGADSSEYLMITKSYILNFQIIGGVFFILSLILAFVVAFLSVVEKNES